jgi:hypothetical protein
VLVVGVDLVQILLRVRGLQLRENLAHGVHVALLKVCVRVRKRVLEGFHLLLLEVVQLFLRVGRQLAPLLRAVVRNICHFLQPVLLRCFDLFFRIIEQGLHF